MKFVRLNICVRKKVCERYRHLLYGYQGTTVQGHTVQLSCLTGLNFRIKILPLSLFLQLK